jgi:hypothetical protein
LRVDNTHTLLTDEDIRRCPYPVLEADSRDLEAFVARKVFMAKHKKDLATMEQGVAED